MIRITHRLVGAFILLGVATYSYAGEPPAEPSAADIATARELFRDGARFAQEEKWEAALDAYERSMALRPSNLTRYSIAVIQERMGRLVEAMENLRAFLAADHDRLTRRYVSNARKMLGDVEARVARVKVVIPGTPRGAQVLIDGQRIPDAAIGVFRPTDPGKRSIEARVPGYPPFVQELTLEEGGEAEVKVRLGQLAHHDHDPSADTGASVEPPAGGGDDTVEVVLIAGGAGVFAAGLGLGIYGYTEATDAETNNGADADQARTFALVGDIGMGVGLVAAGVGTYVLLTGSDQEPSEPTGWVLRPWAGKGSGGIAAAGTF